VSAAIEAIALSKCYSSVWALRDCCVSIPAGSVVALVGPNGAGKTTLLHLAMGLEEPTTGTIDVFGWSPEAQPSLVLPRVGFLAQDRPLYKRFKVREILEFGRRLNPRWDGAMARAHISRLGIPLDRPLGNLSGGQQAQVALLMAIAKRPDLLLLDEPVADLDPLARLEFLQNLMQAVAENGLTVVLSSHIVSELERTCDYLIILSRGQVQVAGEIDTLLECHRSLIGPRVDGDFSRDSKVVTFSETDRQTTALVRIDGLPIGPEWEVRELRLEELVLAYLGRPEASALPRPALAVNGVEPL